MRRLRLPWRRWSAFVGGHLFEPVTLGGLFMAAVYLYSIYSATQRAVDVTQNIVRYERIEENLRVTTEQLEAQADKYRRAARNEPNPLRAERMRQLADEADDMQTRLLRLSEDLDQAQVEFRNVETLNNLLGLYGGNPGAIATPVIDQAFSLTHPGAAASVSVSDYFERRLNAPFDSRLESELGMRLFQVTLEQAFRDCGVRAGNIGVSADCVATELVVLLNRLRPHARGSNSLGAVIDLITKTLARDELRRVLRRRLESRDWNLGTDGGVPDAGAADAGTADAGPEEMADAGPSPPSVAETWPGRWSGIARVTATMSSGIHSDQLQRMELNVTQHGQQVKLTAGGEGRPAVLNISPSNPNAASAKNLDSAVFGNAAAGGQGDTTTDMAAFVREGRLYVAIHAVTDATGHFAGRSATDRLIMDIVGMMERID